MRSAAITPNTTYQSCCDSNRMRAGQCARNIAIRFVGQVICTAWPSLRVSLPRVSNALACPSRPALISTSPDKTQAGFHLLLAYGPVIIG